ncbi:hypothetical protein Pedsa_2502 [Pseudopedobacter saltans DSM 12145]|uniref:Uncharacterized protein n=1 Tax=Pseudopedobacter saltans (strain ATCC 51119 / DSM 12145 / JCM 21818 / CCUG 39354 / LMG 10337 / NBRC 100064 / NCIMB 13643) TaxID=762903 RepID=F0S4M9_PSESL|nr:hypothetical protein [Pseudopedobacter saltans]ADY53047.1 hypothetical protein Pedsa_2502 [Pseudopedobacter saltans DSM 12145]
MSMVNANNPSHYKVIVIGLFVTLFGVYIKQIIEHSTVIDLLGWVLTFVGALISISGVFKILKG